MCASLQGTSRLFKALAPDTCLNCTIFHHWTNGTALGREIQRPEFSLVFSKLSPLTGKAEYQSNPSVENRARESATSIYFYSFGMLNDLCYISGVVSSPVKWRLNNGTTTIYFMCLHLRIKECTKCTQNSDCYLINSHRIPVASIGIFFLLSSCT